jgi:hypothetical protein
MLDIGEALQELRAPRSRPTTNHSARSQLSSRQSRVERCRVCTKHQAWIVFDVFLSLTTPKERNFILRDVFSQIIADWYSAPGRTLFEIKVLKRSGLYNRFRRAASPVDLREWFSLVWPQASDEELDMMMRWAQLREIQLSVTGQSFRGTLEETKKIFQVLDDSKDGQVSIIELMRAEIMTKKEVDDIIKANDADGDGQLDIEEFCAHFQPFLKQKYLSGEARKKFEKERAKKQQAEMSQNKVFDKGMSENMRGFFKGVKHEEEIF